VTSPGYEPSTATSGSLGLPPLPPPIGPILPRPVRRRRGRWILVAVALVGLVGIVAFALAISGSSGDRSLPLPPGMTAPGASAGADPTRTATSQLSAAPPAGDPSGAGPVAPSANASPTPAAPPAVPLRARYSSTPNGLLGLGGYTGTVTITNPGTGAVTGWKVIITLPGADDPVASGAHAEQSDATLTFTPTDATRTVAAGATVSFTFTVKGLLAAQPTGCAIDGRPCD
jgi:hypothetical protein